MFRTLSSSGKLPLNSCLVSIKIGVGYLSLFSVLLVYLSVAGHEGKKNVFNGTQHSLNIRLRCKKKQHIQRNGYHIISGFSGYQWPKYHAALV
jgi:hypothetical protein